ncbi:hypothetical protein CHS0354_009279 [Potamilus streckersoni]|uniref:Cytochrome c oxidase subunit 5A, mitochondrial n=1 Tax=Potamilus streckersoni TaxID=2493646 RepID=A0AAE0W8U3_9BIVA|nr:hypothetical protein CHS0354_009279 [Potamilus streckersoni]
MFRAVVSRATSVLKPAALVHSKRVPAVVSSVRYSHGKKETDQEFDQRYEEYFNRRDIDGWEIRKALNDLQGHDLVPEPKIVIAILKACRRLNDYSLTTRYLEALKNKCGSHEKQIWPYIVQEIRPTLDELGISLPEELGYYKPELALKSVYDMHG